jgi:hypothetical protein
MKHSLHIDKKFDRYDFTKIGSQTERSKDAPKLDFLNRDILINQKELKTEPNFPNTRNSNVFRDSGKNILQLINLEYAKLLK